MARNLGLNALTRIVPPGRRREALAFGLGLAAAVALLITPGPQLFSGLSDAYWGFRERRSERWALAPMLDEAKRLSLGYDAIKSRPEAFKDKPVHWCVDHPADRVSYLSGRPSEPLAWTNEDALPKNSPTSGNRCTWVLAFVEGRPSPHGVLLRFLAVP